MNDKDKELLAQYHHTVSEQLNSRLSESPKFFALVIVVATGYGFVLSNHELSCNRELFILASLLSYGVVLWAAWYLAALAYAFRFLQNIQHCIEHALKWNPRYVPHERSETSGFWLLPSIYHPHVAALFVVLVAVCATFGYHARHWFCWPWLAWPISTAFCLLGILFVLWTDRWYRSKFSDKRRDPAECEGETMPKPDDETALIILTILDLLGKSVPPETVRDTYRKWQEVLRSGLSNS